MKSLIRNKTLKQVPKLDIGEEGMFHAKIHYAYCKLYETIINLDIGVLH